MTHPDTLKWTLGERLAKARRLRQWSQQELADKLGIGRRSIVRYEDDQAVPSMAILIAWATVTDVPLQWLNDTPVTKDFIDWELCDLDVTPASPQVDGQMSLLAA